MICSNKLWKKYCVRKTIYVDDSLCYRPRIMALFYTPEGQSTPTIAYWVSIERRKTMNRLLSISYFCIFRHINKEGFYIPPNICTLILSKLAVCSPVSYYGYTFYQILQNFIEHLFCRTLANDNFCVSINLLHNSTDMALGTYVKFAASSQKAFFDCFFWNVSLQENVRINLLKWSAKSTLIIRMSLCHTNHGLQERKISDKKVNTFYLLTQLFHFCWRHFCTHWIYIYTFLVFCKESLERILIN